MNCYSIVVTIDDDTNELSANFSVKINPKEPYKEAMWRNVHLDVLWYVGSR